MDRPLGKEVRTPYSITDYLGKVQKTLSGCWLLPNKPLRNGYVRLCFGTGGMLAHRWFYEQLVGKIPKNKCVCHHCDIRNCVNPNHLFVGTHSDNTQDAKRKNRLAHPTHQRILREDQVQKIRIRLNNNETCANIAKDYPVTNWAIHSIKQQKNWRTI